MLIGYARVSRGDEQSTRGQIAALTRAGCESVLEDLASGGTWDRPQLHRMLETLQPGDVLVVTKLDRLSRSLQDLLRIMDRLSIAGAGFRSLGEAVDTTTPAGRMMMQMLGSFAEFERAIIRERTLAGLAHARSEGRFAGRKHMLDAESRLIARTMAEQGRTLTEIGEVLGVSRQTVRRAVSAPPGSGGA